MSVAPEFKSNSTLFTPLVAVFIDFSYAFVEFVVSMAPIPYLEEVFLSRFSTYSLRLAEMSNSSSLYLALNM